MFTVLFFGLADAFSEWLAVRWPALPNQIFLGLPYLACFLIMAFIRESTDHLRLWDASSRPAGEEETIPA